MALVTLSSGTWRPTLQDCLDDAAFHAGTTDALLCCVCGEKQKGLTTLLQHRLEAHEETSLGGGDTASGSIKSQAMCPVCHTVFHSCAVLRRHFMRQHMDQGPQESARSFACHKCGERFKTHTDMRQHEALCLKGIDADKVIRCTSCSFDCPSRNQWKLHKKISGHRDYVLVDPTAPWFADDPAEFAVVLEHGPYASDAGVESCEEAEVVSVTRRWVQPGPADRWVQPGPAEDDALDDDGIDHRLWPGAAAQGWRVHVRDNDGHYYYTMPSGATLHSRQEARSFAPEPEAKRRRAARSKAQAEPEDAPLLALPPPRETARQRAIREGQEEAVRRRDAGPDDDSVPADPDAVAVADAAAAVTEI